MKKITIATFALSINFLMAFSANHKTSSEGKLLYEKNCVVCHGIDGSLCLNGAKNLKKSNLTLEKTIKKIAKGGLKMPAFQSLLTTEQIISLSKYTISLR